MNHYISGTVLIILGIGCIVGVYFLMKKIDLPLKKKEDCDNPVKIKKACGSDTKCCGIWDNTQCRKGQIEGTECVAKGNVAPLILGISGIILVIAGIITILFRIFK